MAYDKTKNDINNAFVTLVIFIIIIIILILILYKNNNLNSVNANVNANANIEQFLNYQEAKTKTINWCSKMKDLNLLTSDQYNSCVSSYNSTGNLSGSNIISDIVKNYSLYNTRSINLSNNVLNVDTSKVMILNNNGLYMGCNKDNNVYFIDIYDEQVIKSELEFEFISQNNNTLYTIKSKYGKYLISNVGTINTDVNIPTSKSSSQDWYAEFTGQKIGPMSQWNVKKYEPDEDNLVKLSFESTQLSNYFLSSTINKKTISIPSVTTTKPNTPTITLDEESIYYGIRSSNTIDIILNTLLINYGNDDTNIWKIKPIITTIHSNLNANLGTYNDNKIIQITNLKSAAVKQNCISEYINALQNLKDTINSNYMNIEIYLNNKINILIIDSGIDIPIATPTDTSIDDPDTPLQIPPSNPPQTATGINMTYNDKITLINNLKDAREKQLNIINTDISKLSTALTTANTNYSNTQTEYTNYLAILNAELVTINDEILSNISTIDQYNTEYLQLNNDIIYYNDKQIQIKEIDTISNLNIDMLSKYNDSNSTLIKIYPLILFIILMILLYIMYMVYGKFMENIYYNY